MILCSGILHGQKQEKEEKLKYAKASLLKDPTPPINEISEEEEEEKVETHLGGDPLSCHFTMANDSLGEDN